MSNSKRKKNGKRSSKGPQAQPPPLYSSFGKISEGLLTTGYSKDQILTVSSSTNSGVIFALNAVQHERHSSLGISAQYTYKNTTINVKVDPKSPIAATLTFSRTFLQSIKTNASLKLPGYESSKIGATLTFSRTFLPSIKAIASLKLPSYKSSKLNVQYFQKHAAFAISVALNCQPSIMFSATVGNSSIAVGMETAYMTTTRQFTKYEAGISVRKPSCEASLIIAKKGDLLRASYVHYFDHKRKVAAVAEISRTFSKKEDKLILGISCILDKLTIKARIDNHGKMRTLLQHQIKPKSHLTISSEFNTKSLDKIPRIGLALALKL